VSEDHGQVKRSAMRQATSSFLTIEQPVALSIGSELTCPQSLVKLQCSRGFCTNRNYCFDYSCFDYTDHLLSLKQTLS
jgi:hypothetical protein